MSLTCIIRGDRFRPTEAQIIKAELLDKQPNSSTYLTDGEQFIREVGADLSAKIIDTSIRAFRRLAASAPLPPPKAPTVVPDFFKSQVWTDHDRFCRDAPCPNRKAPAWTVRPKRNNNISAERVSELFAKYRKASWLQYYLAAEKDPTLYDKLEDTPTDQATLRRLTAEDGTKIVNLDEFLAIWFEAKCKCLMSQEEARLKARLKELIAKEKELKSASWAQVQAAPAANKTAMKAAHRKVGESERRTIQLTRDRIHRMTSVRMAHKREISPYRTSLGAQYRAMLALDASMREVMAKLLE